MSNMQDVLSFDNTNQPKDYVMIKSFNAFPQLTLTIELWFKTSHNNPGSPISYATSQYDNAFLLYDYRSLHTYVYSSNLNSGIVFNDGQWHHCAVTWESSTGSIKVYKDGQQEFSGTISQNKNIPKGGALVLGQEQDAMGGAFDVNQAFRGQMTEFRVWNCIRTQQEIQENMQHRLRGNEPELSLYLPLNEGEGTIVNDKSKNANHGTIYGVTWQKEDLDLAPAEPSSPKPVKETMLTTGLEDYARWKSIYQKHKRNPKEKPFRRGRIWC